MLGWDDGERSLGWRGLVERERERERERWGVGNERDKERLVFSKGLQREKSERCERVTGLRVRGICYMTLSRSCEIHMIRILV